MIVGDRIHRSSIPSGANGYRIAILLSETPIATMESHAARDRLTSASRVAQGLMQGREGFYHACERHCERSQRTKQREQRETTPWARHLRRQEDCAETDRRAAGDCLRYCRASESVRKSSKLIAPARFFRRSAAAATLLRDLRTPR
jgi:hypothetical protein